VGHERVRNPRSVEVEDVEERGERTLSVVLQLVTGGTSGTPVPFRYARMAFQRYASADDPVRLRSHDA
jgi:hypothetical protein